MTNLPCETGLPSAMLEVKPKQHQITAHLEEIKTWETEAANQT
jgi:hypothetical protein